MASFESHVVVKWKKNLGKGREDGQSKRKEFREGKKAADVEVPSVADRGKSPGKYPSPGKEGS